MTTTAQQYAWHRNRCRDYLADAIMWTKYLRANGYQPGEHPDIEDEIVFCRQMARQAMRRRTKR